MARIEVVPKKAISKVRASASQVSSGSVMPQEKLKLAFKLLGVSNRISRLLEYRSSSVYLSFCFYFFGRRCWGRRVARPRTIQS